MHETSTEFPDAVFRVLSVLSDEDRGVGTLEVESDDIDSVLKELVGDDSDVSFEPLYADERRAVVQFETPTPGIHLVATESGVPPETPFEIRDGVVRMRMTAPRSRISDFVGRLEEMGIGSSVSYMRSVDVDDILTEKQRVLVEKAVEMGYYDTPRRCSLTELADEVGVAKSTCSDTLHRAEENIMNEFMGAGE